MTAIGSTASENIGKPSMVAGEEDFRICIRNILLPIDFSKTCLAGIPYAVTFAKRFEAKITLLHVIEPPSYPDWGYANLTLRDFKLAKIMHAKIEALRLVADPGGNSIESTVVRLGEADLKITGTARECESDLILMPTHGRVGLGHLLLGSDAERVIRHAPCPVLTLRRPERAGKRLAGSAASIKNILVPIDFSPASLLAIDYAVAFAKRYQANLTLLYVVPTTLPADVTQVTMVLEYERWARLARMEMRKLCAEKIPRPLQVERIVCEGSPHHEVSKQAKEGDFDLVVIAAHGKTGLQRFMLGSTAERIVQYTPCPVLVVREKEHDFITH